MATLLVPSGQPTHPACDLCYARKIKCDRNDPCGNCVDSKASCLRTRPKRVGRPRHSAPAGADGKTDSIITRLSRLETSVTRLAASLSKEKDAGEDADAASPADPNDGAAVKDAAASRSHAGSSPGQESTARSAKRVRLESPAASPPPETGPRPEAGGEAESVTRPASKATEHDFVVATELEAQSFIQGELADASTSIGVDRRSVLEAALDFIGEMEHPPVKRRVMDTGQCAVEISDCLVSPAPEFFHMILSESQRMYPAAYDLEFSTYISRDTLERMALALYNRSADEQTLLQYAVCVNACAGTFLSHLPEYGESTDMQRALEKSKDDYLRRALNAMNYIGILATPSLALLQALLMGTTLFQKLGDTSKCWMLASNACRVCIALGLHHSQPRAPPNDQLSSEDKELRACFLWSYIFDKGLAMSLGRPVCMPIWDVPEDIIAPIDPQHPFSAFVQVLFRFAKVQATIVCDLHFQPAQGYSPQRKEAAISSLKRHMDCIQNQVVEIRASPPHSSDAFLMSEWISLDFVYHSIMTVILRFDTGVTIDPIKREECLDHARRAFVALRNLKTHITTCMNGKTFASFLPWTVLYYPLRPYFVLFCNVVATSHAGDFALMKEFTDILMELPNLNSSAQRLQKLCATLVGLCTPLVQHTQEQQNSARTNTRSNKKTGGNVISDLEKSQQMLHNGMIGDGGISVDGIGTDSGTSIGSWFQHSMLNGDAAAGGVGSPGPHDINASGRMSSSEEMLNALFDVQPSLDWLGSDVFGQGTNWTDFDGGFSMN
ncbi:c6 transcription factor [Diplodia corticola]|uniref:C6 transcription factor n=1 Tax=Diplodia corticola TaxID=236234 RepID=A0A1J9QYF1_9PEZI|nr:c6 transcription factor [Diplodia corticola]OJD33034.1 c6 transcription factor [Diplodia corticola]